MPFTIYADFECAIPKDGSISTGKTQSTQRHVPCAFSYFINCDFNGSLNKFVTYVGEDSPKKFLEYLFRDTKEIYDKYLSQKKPIDKLTPLEELEFASASDCHICKKELKQDRVRDHCHLTGKYRGPAHTECNIQFRVPKHIPIFFHNFSKYDSHLFITELANFDGETKVIPLNKEVYIAMSHYIPMNDEKRLELRFLDSFRFMASSLDKLAKNLPDTHLHAIRHYFPNHNEFKLMRKKGVFPYDYITSFEKLSEDHLPPINQFYNKLTDSVCTPEEYKHAEDVWSQFNCKSLHDYMKLYLMVDVLLLRDIFENFRSICINVHYLDPCHYYTAPSLSWDAMLLYTKVRLELLTDINMYTFFKTAIRGGLVQCSKRHLVANNEFMDDYDPSLEVVYLFYFDMNNLYGKAMSLYLPENNFRWIVDEEFERLSAKETILNLSADSETGYMFEVFLEYPKELHDKHNDLPFCSENKKVGNSKLPKLIADFSEKESYRIHYRTLQQCLSEGLVLKKVVRILGFSQSDWLSKYILKNNRMREVATNDFDKDFYKLLNNSVYGKTMENIDKRRDVKIVTNWGKTNRNRLGAKSLIARPNFNSLSIFADNMVAIQLDRVSVTYDKPIYLGFTVLELSKWLMYDFYYGFLKKILGDDVTLAYMDTDSFIIEVRGQHIFMRISESQLQERFDTANMAADNVYGVKLVNNKKLGMMKDENCGRIMTEFVGLRSKMYAISVQNSIEIKKSKGVNKAVLKKYTIDQYRDCLLNNRTYCDDMYTFVSKKHIIYTTKINKITLNCNDDKRKIKSDGINTYAWGHYKINNLENNVD